MFVTCLEQQGRHAEKSAQWVAHTDCDAAAYARQRVSAARFSESLTEARTSVLRKRTHQARMPDATRLSRGFLAAGAPRSPIFAPALPRRGQSAACTGQIGRMSESGPVNQVGTGKNHRPKPTGGRIRCRRKGTVSNLAKVHFKIVISIKVRICCSKPTLCQHVKTNLTHLFTRTQKKCL
jgi:hypothetical protein